MDVSDTYPHADRDMPSFEQLENIESPTRAEGAPEGWVPPKREAGQDG